MFFAAVFYPGRSPYGPYPSRATFNKQLPQVARNYPFFHIHAGKYGAEHTKLSVRPPNKLPTTKTEHLRREQKRGVKCFLRGLLI